MPIFGSIVQGVVVNEKNSVTLRLSPVAGNPEFAVRSNLGNGSGAAGCEEHSRAAPGSSKEDASLRLPLRDSCRRFHHRRLLP